MEAVVPAGGVEHAAGSIRIDVDLSGSVQIVAPARLRGRKDAPGSSRGAAPRSPRTRMRVPPPAVIGAFERILQSTTGRAWRLAERRYLAPSGRRRRGSSRTLVLRVCLSRWRDRDRRSARLWQLGRSRQVFQRAGARSGRPGARTGRAHSRHGRPGPRLGGPALAAAHEPRRGDGARQLGLHLVRSGGRCEDYRVYVLPQKSTSGSPRTGRSTASTTRPTAAPAIAPRRASGWTPITPASEQRRAELGCCQHVRRQRVGRRLQALARRRDDGLGFGDPTAGTVPIYAVGDPAAAADNYGTGIREQQTRAKLYVQDNSSYLAKAWRDDGIVFYAPSSATSTACGSGTPVAVYEKDYTNRRPESHLLPGRPGGHLAQGHGHPGVLSVPAANRRRGAGDARQLRHRLAGRHVRRRRRPRRAGARARGLQPRPVPGVEHRRLRDGQPGQLVGALGRHHRIDAAHRRGPRRGVPVPGAARRGVDRAHACQRRRQQRKHHPEERPHLDVRAAAGGRAARRGLPERHVRRKPDASPHRAGPRDRAARCPARDGLRLRLREQTGDVHGGILRGGGSRLRIHAESGEARDGHHGCYEDHHFSSPTYDVLLFNMQDNRYGVGTTQGELWTDFTADTAGKFRITPKNVRATCPIRPSCTPCWK